MFWSPKFTHALQMEINDPTLINIELSIQALSTTQLRLSYNSTRRARWHSRLGFWNPPHPICVPLCSLHPEGGIVGCVDVVISRVYPMQVNLCK